jgi:hypothetical protein
VKVVNTGWIDMKRGKENETNEQRSNYEIMFGNFKKRR